MGLIYVDSCVLIYYVEKHPHYSTQIGNIFESLTGERFAISPLVKFECLVGSIRNHDQAMVQRYRAFFDRFIAIDMPESVYLTGATLRAQFGLKTPDALHLACAQHHGCEILLTNDNRLAKASLGMARCVL